MSKASNSARLINNHLSKYVNEDEVFVIHEKVSEIVHADIYVIKPNTSIGRDYYILLTCGMSAIKMNIPTGIKNSGFTELVMLLPNNWEMNYDQLKDENNWWPFRLLKKMIKYPYQDNTWLGYGHTFSYSQGEHFSENCKFEGVIVVDSITLPENFLKIKRLLKKAVKIYSVIPLYREEIDFKEKNGTGELLKMFESNNLPELIQVGRKSII